MQRLAIIFSRQSETRSKAKEYFERIKRVSKRAFEVRDSAADPAAEKPARKKRDEEYIEDPDILIEIGRMAEDTDAKTALLCKGKRTVCTSLSHLTLENLAYLAAARLLKEINRDVPAQLYNNIAALYHVQADSITLTYEAAPIKAPAGSEELPRSRDDLITLALKYYELARDACEEQEGDEKTKDGLRTTLTYNMARLHESRGDLEKAEELHNEVLALHPNYLDSMSLPFLP